MDLLRRYSNRVDLRERLEEVLSMMRQGGAHEKDSTIMATSGRTSSPTWRVRDRLTDDDVNALIADFLDGVPKHYLADQYGVSLGSVKNLLRAHGVRRPNYGRG